MPEYKSKTTKKGHNIKIFRHKSVQHLIFQNLISSNGPWRMTFQRQKTPLHNAHIVQYLYDDFGDYDDYDDYNDNVDCYYYDNYDGFDGHDDYVDYVD